MKKISLFLISIFLLPIMLIGCGSEKGSTNDTDEKVKVIVSISPLKEFTEVIGGDKVEVTTLVPDNVEPHDFELKPRDLEGLTKADIFVYNGLGMESWLDQVTAQVQDTKVKLVNSSENANVIDKDNKIDPHLWLSLKEATNQTENIKNALVEIDEENKDYYEENFKNFKNQLESLYKEYEEKFNSVTNKDFVTSHAAFGYLCREFGLNQISVKDIFGEGELTPQSTKEIIEFCKENNITTIFSESSLSQADADTLARDAGAKVEQIYTLETKIDDMSYIDGMKYNLEKIYESLK